MRHTFSVYRTSVYCDYGKCDYISASRIEEESKRRALTIAEETSGVVVLANAVGVCGRLEVVAQRIEIVQLLLIRFIVVVVCVCLLKCIALRDCRHRRRRGSLLLVLHFDGNLLLVHLFLHSDGVLQLRDRIEEAVHDLVRHLLGLLIAHLFETTCKRR